MKLNNIFKEDIFRPIEGVIKADDETNVLSEVKEYVITKEISKKLSEFLDAYLESKNTNGVWISGFFGSGKSHLLKILSYVLQNKEIEGNKLGNIFLDKIEEDFLKANFRKAISTPSKSILFNIDQKADITNKQQPDAILSVFIKVFNELRGYYPKHGYIAKFEKDLDDQGLYEAFKKRFKEITKTNWEEGREVILLENENFAKVLSEVKKISYDEALRVLDGYESKYKVSIEEFAKDVKDYIDKQPGGFRLNFFVDEVGQYISENTKLMLNLQTIAETLATHCKGRSWIIVTSQQDIDSLIGDLTDKQANDFSRIQARFKTPLSLTSANVDEVIQKRLLDKNDDGKAQLSTLYEKEKNNLRTLIQFVEGRTYKGFQDQEHFNYCYPLLPYQFDLFQGSIRGLSKHNAFQGKHQSVGERSMLSVFQTVVQQLADYSINQIATYDLMFEGLRATLRGEIQSAIIVAERNLSNEFAIKVLKVLFMVKYVKEFKATAKNISTLLIDNIHITIAEHDKKVQEALNLLEEEIYVQRSADVYEFLTDEEKDIEKEIKSTQIEQSDIGDLLADIVFSEIIRDAKLRYEDNKNDYAFSRKMDDTLLSKEQPVSINILTPLSESSSDESILKANSMGKRELLIKLSDDSQLMKDLFLYKRTEKYIQQTHSTTLNEGTKQILLSKGTLNNERRRNLYAKLEEALGKAKIYLNGTELDITNTQPKTKIYLAFQNLIKFAYSNINMLRTIYKEEDLKTFLINKPDDLFKNDDTSMSEAEVEMLTSITRNKQSGERTTTKTIIDRFSGIPYGWPQAGILCILAKIYLRGKVEIKRDSNILDDREIYEAFSNNRHYANTIIEPQHEFDDRKVRKLKDLHQEYFNEANSGKEPKEVGLQFKQKLNEEVNILKTLLYQKAQYKFLEQLEQALSVLEKLHSQEYPYYLNEVDKFEDEILDIKEKTTEPIKRFMNSPQKNVYDEIISFVDRNEENFSYLDHSEISTLSEVRESAVPYKNNTIQKAKKSLDVIQKEIVTKVEEEIKLAISSVGTTIKKVESFEGFSKLNSEQKEQVLSPFAKAIEEIKSQKLIASIKDKARIVNDKYEQQVTLIGVLSKGKDDGGKTPPVEYVRRSQIQVGYSKNELKTVDDVNEYTDQLKDEYLKIIKQNKRILL